MKDPKGGCGSTLAGALSPRWRVCFCQLQVRHDLAADFACQLVGDPIL